MLFLFHGTLEKKHSPLANKRQSFQCLHFLFFFTFSINVHAFSNKLYFFDIQHQSAEQALIQFAKQTDTTIIFSYELVKNHQLNPLEGYFSFEHGLTRLLSKSGLTFEKNENENIRVFKELSDNINFTIAKKNQPITSLPTKKLSVEKIAIVGSRNINRNIQELAVPVDILSNKALENTGQLEVGRMLQALAPSFNFPSSSISDGTDVMKPATLRGLGPDQTLILINGKRRHHASLIHINTSVGRGTAGADLNSIPFQAIERIEILRDGAAAQYGSDAIAGVINIVLKDSPSIGTLHTSFGLNQEGDGQSTDISLNKGFSINSTGYINTTFSYQRHQATNRAGGHGTCQFVECEKLADGYYKTTDKREIEADRDTFKIGDPEYQQYSFSYNANYPILTGELYNFAIISKRDNDSAAFFRHNNNPIANPKLQDHDAVITNGYLPFIHSEIEDHSFSLGFKIDIEPSTSLDISYTFGKNTIDYSTFNSVNASYANMLVLENELSAQQIRKNIPRLADAYGLSLSLQTFNFDVLRNFDNYSAAFGVEFRKDSYQITPGDKYSYFDYDSPLINDEATNNALGGIQGFPGISPESAVDEQRNIASAYFELNIDFTEGFSLSSALRYDDYEDFGETSNLKLAANWQLNEYLKLRSSLSTGFRAPSMQQLYFNNISTQFIVNKDNQLVSEQIGTFRNDSALANDIGIPKLQEEQSTNFSIGSVINFSNNLTMTVDFYDIKIDDRIVISNKLCPEDSLILKHAIETSNVDKAQVFLNGTNTHTQGVDMITTWENKFLQGNLLLTLAANFTNTEVVALKTPKNSELTHLSLEHVFAEQDISIIEEWQPRDRISFTSVFHKNNWSINLALNRYGKYTITDGAKQTYAAKWLTDFRFEQHLSNNFTWFSGVNNLFDVMPDKNRIGNSHSGTIIDGENNVIISSAGVFKYSRRSAPFGFNGSYFYLGINYNF